ncbi:YbaK/EbsC family protein [Spongiibacter taiwanensis]|uniref:aminoacyl-tRNA deacylase n=1 Tax=Spongiibacter taiwanensis TaxID=1748242 RepID=UPI002035207F|nr:YbaK/EbsC family protein [Spongiibacter taiwanensis]USA44107.1 YbaK/EbsC family protein [Spongiibacter taiwanensis]
MSVAPRIEAHLRKVGVSYDLLEHPFSKTSMDTAHRARVPPAALAKAVILHDGECFRMCVIPANKRLMLEQFNSWLGGRFRLATEDELSALFDDCEPGAVPALGQVYGMSVVWDDELDGEEDVYLESGDHRHLIHLRHAAFRELMGLQQHERISYMPRMTH